MTRSVTKFLSVDSMTWLKLKQSGNKSERKSVFEQKLFLFHQLLKKTDRKKAVTTNETF